MYKNSNWQLYNNYARILELDLYIFYNNCYKIELCYIGLAFCCFIKRTVLLFIINIGSAALTKLIQIS